MEESLKCGTLSTALLMSIVLSRQNPRMRLVHWFSEGLGYARSAWHGSMLRVVYEAVVNQVFYYFVSDD